MTELDSSDATGGVGGAPWDFIVRIEPLGSQPTLGLGILVNERVVLTTGAVLPEAGPPFVAVAVVSSSSSAQAEPVQRVASPSGDVVVLRLLEPLPRSARAPQFAQASEGERFETIGEVERDRLTLLGGLLRLGADAPYLTLDLADRGTALAGAPVLVDGSVVGIVTSTRGPDGEVRAEPWTSVAGELAEWAPEIRDAVWPVGPLDQGPVQGADLGSFPDDEFSTATSRVLGWYDAVQSGNEEAPPPSALWTAVVLDAGAFPSNTLASLVPEHLQRAPRPAETTLSKQMPDLGQSARDWFGIPVLPREPNPSPDAARLAALSPVLTKAAEFRDATYPSDSIHVRHLLAALVEVWPGDLEQAGGDAAVFRDELLAAIAERAPEDDQEAWRDIFAASVAEAAPEAAAASVLRRRAGYSADVVGKPGSLTDELNVAADVETLCDVLAAKDAIPPVSVGLFGRWGSGKSYFMALMQERMGALAKAAEDAKAAGQESAYCAEINQITFNAWHYMDANLWATLAVRIFEGLSTTDDGAEERNEAGALLAELNEREKQLASIDVKIGKALADPGLDTAAKRLGVDATHQELIGLAGEVTQFRRYARGARLALFAPDRGTSRRRRRVALVAAVIVALLVATVVALTTDTFSGGLRWVWAAVAVLAGGQFVRVLARVRQALATVNGVLKDAGLKPSDVTQERVATDRRLVEIKERLSEIDRRQGFYNFVLERAGSADYRSQFGLISVVRGDLEKLAGQLVDDQLGRRIVLYIDDLDRCPPSRVVEVLQAVHLLLAFPLFVVVVGVDPRWLLRSLQRHYKEVLSSDSSEEDGTFGSDDDRFWESTPQNYLEKIFQIPFALRPMSSTGFGRLVDQLTAGVTDPGDRGNGERGAPSGTPDQPDAADNNVVRPASVRTASDPAAGDRAPVTPRPAANERVASSAPVPAADPKPRIDPNPATLLIDKAELDFLKGLAELVATPRETKRLVNLYRLVRASLPADAIEPYLHDHAYQPLLTLLAILVGFPRQAQAMFRGLRLVDRGAAPEEVASKVGVSWKQFVALLTPGPVDIKGSFGEVWANWIDRSINANEAAEWAALASALEHVATRPDVVDAIGSYSDWVDVVERYLFDTALAQVTRAVEPASADGV